MVSAADRARAVAEMGVQMIRVEASELVWPAALTERIESALHAERAAVWREAAEVVDAAEWTELPNDAFPMSRSRFKLALGTAVLALAAALRAKGEA